MSEPLRIWWCDEYLVGHKHTPKGSCGNGLVWMADGLGHLRCGFRDVYDPLERLRVVDDGAPHRPIPVEEETTP